MPQIDGVVPITRNPFRLRGLLENRIRRILGCLAALLGLIVPVSTLYGVYRFYSPVPFWDEWDDHLGFYRAVTEEGGWTPWLIPHMEHRVVTSRLLFWLDIRYLGGSHILLLAVEQILLAATVVLIWRSYAKGREHAAPLVWVVGIAAAFLFSWSQAETLRWGYAVQIILVYFFATWACAEYARFEHPRSRRFVAGFALAACAELSMANGIAVPFVLTLISIIGRRPLREIIVSFILSVLLAAPYFIGFVTPHLDSTLTESPYVAMARFVVVFLGNPFYMARSSVLLSGVLGTASLLCAAALTVFLYSGRRINSYRAFLIGVYAFVIVSDLAAMHGRYMMGLWAPLSSRYATGPLLAWVALLLLAYDTLRRPAWRNATLGVGVGLAAVLTFAQLHVRDSNYHLYQWKLGVLSQKIRLDHREFSDLFYPPFAHERFIDMANYAAARDVGVYGEPWLHDAGVVKYDPARRNDGLCKGFLDSVSSAKDGLIVTGWASAPSQRGDMLVVLAGPEDRTVGYGLVGDPRLDVVKALPGTRGDAGWIGFAHPGAQPLTAYAYVGGSFCRLARARGAG
ncbi:hypothetical protein [Caballeronia sp. GAOx1]|uniref:hypothetical protein n=1 Tax=Caballeronia sp. GAOx1 TaxID=2921761 RepID=UPI002028D371|nr:hypothetical protein [Caballeronia sp. GAOx1]